MRNPHKIQARDLADAPVTIQVHAEPAELDLSDPDYRFPDPVSGEVTFRQVDAKLVMASGELATAVESDCVRCLTPVRLTVRAPFRARFEHNEELLKPDIELLGHEEEVIGYFDGEEIHPQAQYREALMSELPALPMCAPDCRGLCQGCGANLNTEACRCKPAPPAGDVAEEGAPNAWKEQLKRIKLDS